MSPGSSLYYCTCSDINKYYHEQSHLSVFVFLYGILEHLIKQLLEESKLLLGERLDHSGYNFRGHGLRVVHECGD